MTSQASQDRNTVSSTFYILAAHGGAGFHPPTSDSSLKCSLREAVSSALTTFSDPTTTGGDAPESSALDAATTLIAALEDAPDFNAGYGSNLTFDGDVECDASLMSTDEEEENGHSTVGAASPDRTPSSSYSFGSVGAVRGVRNPVLLARRVLEGRRRRRGPGPEEKGTTTMMTMGRVPPLMLVGEGALRFAKEQGLRVVDRSEEMVSPRARREWQVWRERWDRCCRGEGENDSDAGLREVGSSGLGEPLAGDPDSDLGGEVGHEEESESAMTPRAGSDGGGDGDAETLRARQDTVGAVVLVGGADDVHQQVATGVSRCVVCSQTLSPLSSSSPCPSSICILSLPRALAKLALASPVFTAVVCYSSTLDALARSVGQLVGSTRTSSRTHIRARIHTLVGRTHEPEGSVLDFLQAAVFGAGCWAERSVGGGCRVACSVSGQGELIVQSLLAKTLAERIIAASTADGDDDTDTHAILRSVLVDEFYGASPAFFFLSPRMSGFTACVTGAVRFSWS